MKKCIPVTESLSKEKSTPAVVTHPVTASFISGIALRRPVLPVLRKSSTAPDPSIFSSLLGVPKEDPGA